MKSICTRLWHIFEQGLSLVRICTLPFDIPEKGSRGTKDGPCLSTMMLFEFGPSTNLNVTQS